MALPAHRLRAAGGPAAPLAALLGALLALALAGSAQALSLSGVSLSVTSTSSSGTSGTSFDGMELTGSSTADDDMDASDDTLLLTEGDLALTSSDTDTDPTAGDGYHYSGPSGEWRLSDWELDIEADPFLGAVVAVANLSSQAQTFDITLDVPVSAVFPQSLLDGSLAEDLDFVVGDLTDLAGAELYTARLDGTDVAGSELGPTPPFTVSGSFSSPGSIGADSFSGLVGPPVASTIGIHWRFELDGFSAALFDSTLNVVAVPEPSTFALAALGVAGLAAARRRLH